LDIEAIVDVEGEEDLISFRDLLRWLHEGRRWITLADGSVAKLDPKILNPVAEAAGDLQFDKNGHAEVSTLGVAVLVELQVSGGFGHGIEDLRIELGDAAVRERDPAAAFVQPAQEVAERDEVLLAFDVDDRFDVEDRAVARRH